MSKIHKLSPRRILGLAAAAVLSAAVALPAHALKDPDLSEFDRRIKYIDYNPDDVTPINAVEGLITTITFAPDEVVKDYGSGFNDAWEFAPRGNNFFMKAKAAQGTTNLTIVTNKRVYVFDVRYTWNRKTATYRLIFRYPEEEAARKKAAMERARDLALLKRDPIDTRVTPPKDRDGVEPEHGAPMTAGALVGTNPAGEAAAEREVSDGYNWDYEMNFGSNPASKDIAPYAVYDDGRFTVIRFRPGQEIPTVYEVKPEDGELLVPRHIKDGAIVVETVVRELRLRNGQAVVGIYNLGYGKNFKDTPDNTTLPGMKRTFTRAADRE